MEAIVIVAFITSFVSILITIYNVYMGKKLEVLKQKNETLIFVTNKQYEKEYEIYQELWALLVDCYGLYFDYANYVLKLTPIWREYRFISLVEGRGIELIKVASDFENKSSKLEPFYDNTIYKKIRRISEIAIDMEVEVKEVLGKLAIEGKDYVNSDQIQESIRAHINSLISAKKEASDEIRNYLEKLKVNN